MRPLSNTVAALYSVCFPAMRGAAPHTAYNCHYAQTAHRCTLGSANRQGDPSYSASASVAPLLAFLHRIACNAFVRRSSCLRTGHTSSRRHGQIDWLQAWTYHTSGTQTCWQTPAPCTWGISNRQALQTRQSCWSLAKKASMCHIFCTRTCWRTQGHCSQGKSNLLVCHQEVLEAVGQQRLAWVASISCSCHSEQNCTQNMMSMSNLAAALGSPESGLGSVFRRPCNSRCVHTGSPGSSGRSNPQSQP